ncbi:FecCD family ABC transporter permease [Actinomadura flavalba]|uniref:FecCD family ABC transporter permease n=1 Tax=Actinomadura flavalba TaxID=1120938 RepID=UPI00039A0321|nr:iron chelate uptake ABC transporter family permease subunit [Actinomadura flavalba]
MRVGPVGVLVRPRAGVAGLVVAVALLGVAGVAVFSGSLDIAPARVLAALAGDGTRVETLVVVDRRLARTLAAVLVGFALGCAGALTQSITRNPIASPDILGVTTGAGFFAVLLITHPALLPGGSAMLAAAAITGGLVTTGGILALSWRAGFDGLRLILVGISVNAIGMAGVSWLLLRTDIDQAAVAMRWLTGSLSGARMPDVLLLAPFVLAAGLACAYLARDLAALRLGRSVAPALGTAPGRTEALALLVAVVLASGATAVAGPVAFAAFVAPQAAMRLFGTAGPPPLAGGLTGALLILAADLTAQRLPAELPVGVVTAVVGAPFLLYLLHRHRRRTSV